ncbi:CNP1-like family protein [Neisseria chenwenguii]|uniref:Cryptic protein cnp1 n=1 Tax=Neisseria chenwenguii TaxID=1853278 RepID=A0A220S4M5_9NEIS|nr:CNP1-like family protein [Neisseria chenwenguii]ASK28372.1 cryptic protein cnp1 [Neisseria chenwenguii]ROV55875.1 cryptic protein cnp1 [Neisseria chenwenguii]
MRRLSLLLLAFAATSASALPVSEKNTLTNTRYKESASEKASREFKEADAALPALPDTKSGNWFDIYVSETYAKRPKILLDSIQIMPAPDTSIRYVLNTQSAQGHDNLTYEALFCARSSFTYKEDKRSSYKIFGYGDSVNKRWIQPRNAGWKNIGTTLERNDDPRAVIYNAFCVDGIPRDAAQAVSRLKERAGRHKLRLRNTDK